MPLPKVNAPSALAVHKPQASYELPDANQLDIDKLINSVKAASVRQARNARDWEPGRSILTLTHLRGWYFKQQNSATVRCDLW